MVYEPNYMRLWRDGILEDRVERSQEHYEHCLLCPHNCGINRRENLGVCQAPAQAVVASFGPHFGEETVLVGRSGSGTIFFGHCNLRCVFCQNSDLSFGGAGKKVEPEELGKIMLRIQNDSQCHNLNLVTPTHFVPVILEALLWAVPRGFRLPLVYNSGGYEQLATLELLDGIIDIYLPDFKYADAKRGEIYSGVADYPKAAQEALKEMDRQVGGLQTDDKNTAIKGLIIRHLVLPGGVEDSKMVLDFIKEELSPGCLVNLMGQYYPHHQAWDFSELTRPLGDEEFEAVWAYAKELGLQTI